MEESVAAANYWCHACSQMVSPTMEVDIKCPLCLGGFVEEMSSSSPSQDPDSDLGSDRALSLWAPILLGMMGNPRRRRRLRRLDFDDDDDADDAAFDYDDAEARRYRRRHHEGETELDRELDSIIRRRRRRSSATILQLLQGIQAGMASESDNNEVEDGRDRDRDRDRDRNSNRERERERVILINPFNQTIIVQGSYDSRDEHNHNHTTIGSLGDYFIGPGLDLLLQHLAENDPNRYGSPPARKEAIEAMPTVTIKENLQCSVCLDDFEVGAEAKEMPCKHKFHTACIFPWLELHSSCPVCRYQLPADESKLDSDRTRNSSNQRESQNNNISDSSSSNNNGHGGSSEEGEGDGRNGSGRRFSFPWPFNGLFSSSSAQSGGGGNSSSSGPQPGSASQTDEN